MIANAHSGSTTRQKMQDLLEISPGTSECLQSTFKSFQGYFCYKWILLKTTEKWLLHGLSRILMCCSLTWIFPCLAVAAGFWMVLGPLPCLSQEHGCRQASVNRERNQRPRGGFQQICRLSDIVRILLWYSKHVDMLSLRYALLWAFLSLVSQTKYERFLPLQDQSASRDGRIDAGASTPEQENVEDRPLVKLEVSGKLSDSYFVHMLCLNELWWVVGGPFGGWNMKSWDAAWCHVSCFEDLNRHCSV